MDWFYSERDERKGPVDVEGLKALIKEEKLSKSDYVWNQSMGDKWTQIADVLVLAGPKTDEEEDPRVKEEFQRNLVARRKAEPDQYGLTNVPDGRYSTFDKGDARGIWIEHGMYGKHTIIYLQVVE